MTPGDGWPGWLGSGATWRSPRGSRPMRPHSSGGSPAVSGWPTATTRWPWRRGTCRRARIERRALPLERDRPGRAGRARAARHLVRPALFSGWGIRTYGADSRGYNPHRLPHRQRLAARHRDRRGRPQVATGFDEARASSPAACFEAAQSFPGFRLARALLRVRSRRDGRAGPLYRLPAAPGLGRRRPLMVISDILGLMRMPRPAKLRRSSVRSSHGRDQVDRPRGSASARPRATCSSIGGAADQRRSAAQG